MAFIGNILWFILGGAINAIGWLIAALIFAITIIGLPVARACLEFAKLSALPFGKVIIRDTELYGNENVSGFSKVVSVILNIIWFPIGLVLTILYFALAIVFFVTIIGIPFGIVYWRMAKFVLFPIGARVVSKEEAALASITNKASSSGSSLSNKKCRQCSTVFSGSVSICPKCGSTLYEEVNISTAPSPNIPINRNIGETWVCKKCNETNPITASTCKGCGEYK